jgi:hypothetical protein
VVARRVITAACVVGLLPAEAKIPPKRELSANTLTLPSLNPCHLCNLWFNSSGFFNLPVLISRSSHLGSLREIEKQNDKNQID